MVEIKAIEQLLGVHKAQAINYCEAYKIADGLLINFGSKSLDFKRVYNKKVWTRLKDYKKDKIRNQGNPIIS